MRILERTFTILLLSFLVSACVTINIYFPAAAAEKAADRIIDDVWGDGVGNPGTGGDTSSIGQPLPIVLLEYVVSPASAGEANININSPAVDALRASMRGRHAKLQGHYASGAIGLTRDALIVARDMGSVPLRERAVVQRLIAQENDDRNALYREIAKANGHPEWSDEIRATFARRWIEKAPGGWWYQEGGGWRQK